MSNLATLEHSTSESESSDTAKPKTAVEPQHHVCFFVSRKWQSGLLRIVQGSFLLTAGIFLLTQATSTPNLLAQMIILGCVLTVGGCYFLWSSLSDLLGFFRVDRQGLHLRDSWSIRSIPWSHVVAWQVNSGSPRDLQRAVRIVLPEPHHPVVIDGDCFHNDDLLRIHGVMLQFAAANGNESNLAEQIQD